MGRKKDNQIVADKLLADLIRAFLVNYTYKECKKKLWDFYSEWVFSFSEIAAPKESGDILMFYERLLELMKAAAKYSR